ncbi:hypothetical protein IWX90DRAFT_274456 [Phyllosticta citrichinensis]|uniref:Uncharacterized protein n=1 Tax=Phyllosticta citrichinensis TaxID=1130410 RepID=A0ABR1XMZ2_9PEZI
MAGARPNGVTSGSQRLSNVYGVARQFHPRILRDYFERLNFFSPENHRKYGQLEAAVDRNAVSWVPLGSADNALYRLHPEFDGLLPHGKATRQSLPLEFLGVNTNVAPQTGSRRTADSAESDDVGNECFVAHQLGELTSWSRDKKRLRPSDEGEKYKNSDNWEKTGFFVVAQLSFSGIAERLYLIVDSFSQLEDGSRPLSTTTTGDDSLQNHTKSNLRAPDSRGPLSSFQAEVSTLLLLLRPYTNTWWSWCT